MPDGTASDSELEVLLADDRTYPPPPEFTAQANASDPAIYEEAERDSEGWWESWARELEWAEPWDAGARLEPALGQVVRRRQAERLLQLPRPPRRGRASATASPITGRARTASAARSPTPTCSR